MMLKKIGSKKGMTLIELLITTVIIGLVAAMAVPRVHIAYERHKMNAAHRNIISSMRLARSQAITDKEQIGVYFDESNQSITIFKDKVNTDQYDFVSGDSVIRVDTLPAEFDYIYTDVTNDVFLFRPNGACHFEGTGYISALASSESVVAIYDYQLVASTGKMQSYAYLY